MFYWSGDNDSPNNGATYWQDFLRGRGDLGFDIDVITHPHVPEWPTRLNGLIVSGVLSEPALWGSQIHASGSGRRKFIAGTVYDTDLNPVSGASVMLFKTTDRSYVGEDASDASGDYLLLVPYNTWEYFLLAYKDDTPDTAGTTVNTVTGS